MLIQVKQSLKVTVDSIHEPCKINEMKLHRKVVTLTFLQIFSPRYRCSFAVNLIPKTKPKRCQKNKFRLIKF